MPSKSLLDNAPGNEPWSGAPKRFRIVYRIVFGATPPWIDADTSYMTDIEQHDQSDV